MPFRIEADPVAYPEFLALPKPVRETFEEAWKLLEGADSPIINGIGKKHRMRWSVEELTQRQFIASEGLFSLHVGEPWRGLFIKDKGSLFFFAFGPHQRQINDIYRRLKGLRAILSRRGL
jgi:hypothetical protein